MNCNVLFFSTFFCIFLALFSSTNGQLCKANFSNYAVDLVVVQETAKDPTKHMATIFDELQKEFPESRLGAATFSDEGYQTWESKSQAYRVLSPLTVEKETLLKNIADFTACEDCGGHFPDSSLVAIATAATDKDLRWSEFSVTGGGLKIVKSLVVITNTDPLMAGDQRNSTLGNYMQKHFPDLGRHLSNHDVYLLGLIGPAGQAAWSSHLKAMTGARGVIQNMPGTKLSIADGNAMAKLIIDGMKKFICQYFEGPNKDKESQISPGYLDRSQEGHVSPGYLDRSKEGHVSPGYLDRSKEGHVSPGYLDGSQEGSDFSAYPGGYHGGDDYPGNLGRSHDEPKMCTVTVSIERPQQFESHTTLPVSVVEDFDRISSPVPSQYPSDFGVGNRSPITGVYSNLVLKPRDLHGGAGGSGSYMVASADHPTSLMLGTAEGVEIQYIGGWLSDIDESNQIDFDLNIGTRYSWNPFDLPDVYTDNAYKGNPTYPHKEWAPKSSMFVNWEFNGCHAERLTFTGEPGSTAPINIDNLTLGTSSDVSREVNSETFVVA